MTDFKKIKIIPELGLMEFNPMECIRVDKTDEAILFNMREKVRVNLDRLKYMENLIDLGVSTRSLHWNRLVGNNIL